MRITTETELKNFKFWNGAKENAKKLTDKDFEQLDETFNDLYPDGINRTLLNDLFWFDFGYVCELIGLYYNDETDKIER